MNEPSIRIGDHVLTEAQSMAVRVAVTSFHAETAAEGCREQLGPIADAYHARLGEVLNIMLTAPRS
jgi:hypothetical protein